jgi:hypothetical protein
MALGKVESQKNPNHLPYLFYRKEYKPAEKF